MANTTTRTRGIQARLSRRPIEILLPRKPFANRKMVRLGRSSLLRFEREPTATPEPYGTGLNGTRGIGWTVGPLVLIAPRAEAPRTRHGCETACIAAFSGRPDKSSDGVTTVGHPPTKSYKAARLVS